MIYLTFTHPDITYVGVISQFMHAPHQPHFDVVYGILRYLKGAPGQWLLYKPSPSLTMTKFSDVDWVGSCYDQWSTFRYCTLLVVILLPSVVRSKPLLLVLVSSYGLYNCRIVMGSLSSL